MNSVHIEYITFGTALLTFAVAAAAFVRSFFNGKKIDIGNAKQEAAIHEIHLSVNSRLTQFIEEVKKAAWLGGRAEASAEEKKER